ncbi:MAG: ribbon-helix-helix protein, CopG family [Anaerolineae bacterium]
MKSIYIPAPLHRELKVLAAQKGKTLSEVVRRLLRESLERERTAALASQERLLIEGYQAMATEHAQLAEESVHYVVEALDPDEDWEEYQE